MSVFNLIHSSVVLLKYFPHWNVHHKHDEEDDSDKEGLVTFDEEEEALDEEDLFSGDDDDDDDDDEGDKRSLKSTESNQNLGEENPLLQRKKSADPDNKAVLKLNRLRDEINNLSEYEQLDLTPDESRDDEFKSKKVI
jgi:hypothetical protein